MMNIIIAICLGLYLGGKLDDIANKIEEKANKKK